jgi:hypothetical protein
MKTEIILSQIKQYIPIDDSEADYLGSLLIPKTVKQGETIVTSSEPAHYMIWVNEGYLMTYYTNNEPGSRRPICRLWLVDKRSVQPCQQCPHYLHYPCLK